MSTAWHRIRRLWAISGSVLLVVWLAWCVIAFQPNADARAAMQDSTRVHILALDDAWLFQPAHPAHASVSLLFFPGALVDPQAYAPLMRGVAASGHRALLMRTPWRGAFGQAEAAAVLAGAHAHTRALGGRWVVAGHSRGGKAAAHYAHAYGADIDGLMLIGTSHPRDIDLSAAHWPVLQLLGDRDRIASPERADRNRARLPAGTHRAVLSGANHSQFGDYGFQPGDRIARMSRTAQRQATMAALLTMLSNPPNSRADDIR